MEGEGQDVRYMQRALELAAHGLGTTSPNPPVGAVIVGQGGVVLGEGFHAQAGQPHAERLALADARSKGNGGLLKGSTIYVTLEPCSSYGRTPPCTEGILEAGIGRVVYGSVDPDERHRGRADALLKAAGVSVQGGVCKAACDRFLRPWMHAVTTKRPWVLAKTACTLDGRLTRAKERWLSGEESLRYVHDLHLWSDAILVGGNTVRSDDPSLTIRTPNLPVTAIKKQPWRVVLTQNRKNLPADAKIFTDAHADRTLVYEGVEDLRALLESLYKEQGVVNLMLECGGRLLRHFLEEGLVDEWVQVITPTIGGGGEFLLPGGFLPAECHFTRESLTQLGADLILRGTLDR
mgnify:CR=1 FL=1